MFWPFSKRRNQPCHFCQAGSLGRSRCETSPDKEGLHPALEAAAPDASSRDARGVVDGEHRQCRSAHKATVIPSSAAWWVKQPAKYSSGAVQEVAAR